MRGRTKKVCLLTCAPTQRVRFAHNLLRVIFQSVPRQRRLRIYKRGDSSTRPIPKPARNDGPTTVSAVTQVMHPRNTHRVQTRAAAHSALTALKGAEYAEQNHTVGDKGSTLGTTPKQRIVCVATTKGCTPTKSTEFKHLRPLTAVGISVTAFALAWCGSTSEGCPQGRRPWGTALAPCWPSSGSWTPPPPRYPPR